MSKVLILGAAGRIAREAIPLLAAHGHELTLFARDASRVDAPAGARVIEGDVLDAEALARAVDGQDIVYANLGGELSAQAEAVVAAMKNAEVDRLVFIDALGIYHELPEPFETWNQQMIGDALQDYRRAADVIEAAGIDHTIVRPAWLTNADETDYELTARDEQFKGTEVSRKAVGAFVARVVDNPREHSRANVGVNKPGTEGEKPAFM